MATERSKLWQKIKAFGNPNNIAYNNTNIIDLRFELKKLSILSNDLNNEILSHYIKLPSELKLYDYIPEQQIQLKVLKEYINFEKIIIKNKKIESFVDNNEVFISYNDEKIIKIHYENIKQILDNHIKIRNSLILKLKTFKYNDNQLTYLKENLKLCIYTIDYLTKYTKRELKSNIETEEFQKIKEQLSVLLESSNYNDNLYLSIGNNTKTLYDHFNIFNKYKEIILYDETPDYISIITFMSNINIE